MVKIFLSLNFEAKSNQTISKAYKSGENKYFFGGKDTDLFIYYNFLLSL